MSEFAGSLWQEKISRRLFLGRSSLGVGTGVGTAALATLLGEEAVGQQGGQRGRRPRARRVIYLCQSGAPSQLDLFDHKPGLVARFGQPLPDSIRKGQRLTTMTSGQKQFPVAPSIFRFRQHGHSGAMISELLPFTARMADELCLVRSMHTEAINHDPAITLLQTGSQQAGRPSFGAWLSYGLGSENRNLPSFVALTSWSLKGGQPLYDRLWGSGFLPTRHQGVRFRAVGDPVLFLSNPHGIASGLRRELLDDVARLNRLKLDSFGDPEIETRMAQYELAFRMQTSVPELVDFSDEPRHVLDLYGPDVARRGSYASNCLLARRLSERGVRFIQLFHRGWDQHSNLPRDIRELCRATDQPSAGLLRDLKQRGLLDDTLVIWAGEFGRTVYSQGELTSTSYGRDHHPRCFSVWMAGGGVRGGTTYGATDDFSYNVAENGVHVHDLNATLLYCLGIDHRRLTFKYQGRHHRLTDVHGRVVEPLLA
ncbi:MAG: sulfatase [Planctomycetaceae bacterium]|nr:sulfatase [Planctomycetaceae bacterium]